MAAIAKLRKVTKLTRSTKETNLTTDAEELVNFIDSALHKKSQLQGEIDALNKAVAEFSAFLVEQVRVLERATREAARISAMLCLEHDGRAGIAP